MSSNPSKYLLVSLAAGTDPEIRQRVITACELKGHEFREDVLRRVLLRFSHNLQAVSEVVGAVAPLTDANIDTALAEIFPEEGNGND